MPERREINREMILILLGAPGAGKGTQCARLAQSLVVPHISTGNILRDHIERRSDLGVRIKTIVETGGLVPDGLMLDLLDERLKKSDCATGFILDGLPRTFEQAVALDSRLHPLYKGTSPLVVRLIVSEYSLLRRLEARRICPSCGESYSNYLEHVKTPGICEHDGATLVARSDDGPATVHRRLLRYQEKISPIVEHYSRNNVLITIDGDQPAHRVTTEILKEITSHRKRRKPIDTASQLV
ncbi:MAG TPA: nucleoside monophosphate kinase [Terriglobales bacterium]|nr:nucleoside monophosphate kinase [Terriglobales bacterium]